MTKIKDQPPAGDRRWRPSPLLSASGAFHLAGVVSVLVSPRLWPWTLGALVLNQFSLAVIGTWPRSHLLGPNVTRIEPEEHPLGSVALTFDDGPDKEVTPRVLDLLDRFDAKATFFCVGKQAREFPRLVTEIATRGHEVGNHTDSHRYSFAFFGPKKMNREIDRAQEILSELAGRPPRFFRPPAGARNPLLEPSLVRRGLRLVTWTRRGFDAVASEPERILKRLTAGLGAGDILLLHDGNFWRNRSAQPQARAALAVLPALLKRLKKAGLRSVALTPKNTAI